MPSEKKPKSYKEEFMIQLSDHFDYKRLLRYTLPSIIMLRKAVKPKLLGLFIGICSLGIIIVGYLFNVFQYLLI